MFDWVISKRGRRGYNDAASEALAVYYYTSLVPSSSTQRYKSIPMFALSAVLLSSYDIIQQWRDSSRTDSLYPEAHVVRVTFSGCGPYLVICQFPKALVTSNLVDFKQYQQQKLQTISTHQNILVSRRGQLRGHFLRCPHRGRQQARCCRRPLK